MTLEEILKGQGLSDDQIKAVMTSMKENKLFMSTEENIDLRYSKLKTEHDALTSQHEQSVKLIDQLKAGTKDSETLQKKITSYEAQIQQMHVELEKTKLESAIKVALLDAKVKDVDYMTFKLKEKGELKLDEYGKVKGIDDMLAGLKVQFPTQFESAEDRKEIKEHELPDHDENKAKTMTRAEFLRKPYRERAEFQAQNPDAYNAIMNS